ncbi:NAD-dependent succinate-semialdehyde dehydrogenase [Streptomyces sp. RS2]|uniref:NAD-dependent succinate-semialdehyde dehydrogenase n=1 Tax=Streptomyces sp. RS2 TaxID=1451205 RepID=UPI0021F8EE7C|nr:NAD-dependent succinate-semialdehyde dehydrogenase [Streptomyces sp. RS2]MCW1100228.1 NAD-dependent succinate-semialdehyde dehydrogenase [Streptomyces sp. RS2]
MTEAPQEPPFQVVDPATGVAEPVRAAASDAELDQAIATAHRAYTRGRATSVSERIAALRSAADQFDRQRERLAAIATHEMGKPVRQALGEVDLCAAIYRYYADHAAELLTAPQPIAARGLAVVRREPVGPLLGVMPWNYPYYQVARFAAPNLLLGNTVLLKPAPQCPTSALALQELHASAGFEPGAYTTVLATEQQVARMISDDRVRGVSLTGSERAGAAVAQIAGANLKKVVLELGGCDPYVVLGPVDQERAVRDAVFGRFGNAGQACNAAKRIVVTDELFEEFTERFTAAVAAIQPGDPTDPSTFLGPMSSRAALDTLADQVTDALDLGATALTGGAPLERSGAWFAPTVLTGITPKMRAWREELFGPVAIVHRVPDEAAAVELANDSPYGLGAVIQCEDLEVCQRVAEQLDVGMVHLNEPPGTAPELPFGGIKRSGTGRELGRWGLDEFANFKLIHRAC